MSRRHRGRPHHHGPGGPARFRPNATAPAASASFPTGTPPVEPVVPPVEPIAGERLTNGGDPLAPGVTPGAGSHLDITNGHDPLDDAPVAALPLTNGHPVNGQAPSNGQRPVNGAGSNGAAHEGPAANGNGERTGQCTAPQLRRFIKSRPYVPMHELRRRFAIDGADDDVTPVKLEPGWVYVGLPSREGTLLGDLLRSGEIGYELSLDPRTPIVIGVYPMRPIPRS
jgi:hypothetical protein